MKRILVIGSGGSGKTHLSNILGRKLNLPVFHMDQLFWGSNWRPADRSQYRSEVRAIVDKSAWVIDGNYSSTFDLRIPEADTIIFLDRSPLLCLFRVVKRRISYNGRTRPSMSAGNKEKLNPEFISYVLGFRHTRRPGILEMLNTASHADIFILKSNAQVEKFIRGLSSS